MPLKNKIDMKYLKSLLVWLCFIPTAILNGGVREYVLVVLTTMFAPTIISRINKRYELQ